MNQGKMLQRSQASEMLPSLVQLSSTWDFLQRNLSAPAASGESDG